MKRVVVAHPEALKQIAEYREHLTEIGRSKHTLHAYAGDLQNFAEWTMQPLWPAPENLDGVVQRWLAYRRSQGDTIVSIRRRIFSVKSYYHYAGVAQLLTSIVHPKTNWYVPKLMKSADVERLMAEISQTDSEAFNFFRLILLTGFRFEELYTINYSLEDIQKRKVVVRDGNGKARSVVLGNASAFILEEVHRGDKLRPWKQSRSSILRVIEIAGVIAGIKNATYHTLRCTCAARMIASGLPRDFVKSNMGYLSDTTMNMITKVAKRDLADEFGN